MTLISTTTVGSGGAANITFSSIPQTFTDLFILFSMRSSANDQNGGLTFNTGGTYTYRWLIGAGSGTPPSGTGGISFNIGASAFTTNTFGNGSITIPNYSGSAIKSWSADSVTENNATLSYAGIVTGAWSSTAAITSLVLAPLGGSFIENSSASLYGILKGSGGATVS
jgi:hypothetical protein